MGYCAKPQSSTLQLLMSVQIPAIPMEMGMVHVGRVWPCVAHTAVMMVSQPGAVSQY